VIELLLLDELDEFFEFGFRLARESRNQCRPQRQVRDAISQRLDQRLRPLTRHATRHPAKHVVVDVLQRHVDVGQDLLGAGEHID